MLLNTGALSDGELTGFIEDGVGNGELAEVVEQSGATNELATRLRQVKRLGDAAGDLGYTE